MRAGGGEGAAIEIKDGLTRSETDPSLCRFDIPYLGFCIARGFFQSWVLDVGIAAIST
jgi:hypothetical protein